MFEKALSFMPGCCILVFGVVFSRFTE
jgi:hypothetical protein